MRARRIVWAATLAAGCGSSGSGFGGSAPSLLCNEPDCDHDGVPAPVDCDDMDPLVNPDAYDFPGDGIDQDCSGKPDDAVETCETIPTQSPGSPVDFARAADLCPQRTFDPLVRAEWGEIKGYGPGQ